MAMVRQSIVDFFQYGKVPTDETDVLLLPVIQEIIGNPETIRSVNNKRVEGIASKEILKIITLDDLRMLANNCILARMAAQYNGAPDHAVQTPTVSKQQSTLIVEGRFPKGALAHAIRDHFLKDDLQGGGTEEILHNKGIV